MMDLCGATESSARKMALCGSSADGERFDSIHSRDGSVRLSGLFLDTKLKQVKCAKQVPPRLCRVEDLHFGDSGKSFTNSGCHATTLCLLTMMSSHGHSMPASGDNTRTT